MSPLAHNVLMAVLIAVGAAILTTGVQLGQMLSSTDPLAWRPIAATFVSTLFGTLMTAGVSMLRPKIGREEVSALVGQVGPVAAKAALEDEVVRQATGEQPVTVAAVADELERRRDERVQARLHAVAEDGRATLPDPAALTAGLLGATTIASGGPVTLTPSSESSASPIIRTGIGRLAEQRATAWPPVDPAAEREGR